MELRAGNLFASLALAGLLAACGARSIVSLDDGENGDDTGRAPGTPGTPGTPKTPGSEGPPLEHATGPVALFDHVTPYRFARVVARNGGFDLLAGRGDSPRVTMGRRATLADPLRLVLGDAETVVASSSSGWNAEALGDRLMLCHVASVGDPVLFTTHTGAYTAVVTDRFLYENGFCNGFAFVDETTGLLAVTRGRPVRPTLAQMGVDGFRGTEFPAFPNAEPTVRQIAVTAHAGRFAWAGYVDEAAAVRVGFGSGPVLEQSVDIPSKMIADGRPRIEPWPYSDAVSVSWQESEVRSRVVAIGSDGSRPLDIVIEHPEADFVSRPELAPTPNGLVVAYSVSRAGRGDEMVVELFGANGRRRMDALEESLEDASPIAVVHSAAALGALVLVVTSGRETREDASGSPYPANFDGYLYRTAP